MRTFISRLQGENTELAGNGALYLSKVDHAAARMKRLIDDILAFSQIATAETKLIYSKTDLNDVLKTVGSNLEVIIESSSVVIIPGKMPVVDANGTQMCQLFQNLIANAIKFADPARPPVISINASMIRGADIINDDLIRAHFKFSGSEKRFWDAEQFYKITFSDNGIGFEAKFADRIFETFQRLEKTHQGTGIGLAICKKIAENHHGQIYAESEPGKGAVFTVILPVSQTNFE
ncbi:sensor histidine kinase [Flavipsychrobacter stenotrophus]|uniref:sensor histidine kinase n=1 Tax=Flavipsychrobacter stenotrophus TaxID=2077091 RepID=UPI003741F14E